MGSFNDQKSSPLTVVNFGSNYRLQDWTFGVDLLNLFDSEDNDIEYAYAARLSGEPVDGMQDIHFHPIYQEPCVFRFSIISNDRSMKLSL